jgi:hypothetical protein
LILWTDTDCLILVIVNDNRFQETDMNFRKWMNTNSKAVIGVSVAVILIFLISLFRSCTPASPPRITRAYYYDLGTNQLFSASESNVPPIPAPSDDGKKGQASGVHAYVFSCGDCDDDTKRFIGYLETFTPEAHQAAIELQNPNSATTGPAMSAHIAGRLVMNPDDKKTGWVPSRSRQGSNIQSSKCGAGHMPTPCFP